MKMTILVLALASLVFSKPTVSEPRSIASAPGSRIVSDGEYGYTTLPNKVFRMARTASGIVVTDSAQPTDKHMTESSQYVPRDSLHGYLISWESVCAVDWTVHPGKVSKCVAGLRLDGSTGGLTFGGRGLTTCGGSNCYSFDLAYDSIRLVDSLPLPGHVVCKTDFASERVRIRYDSAVYLPSETVTLLECNAFDLDKCTIGPTVGLDAFQDWRDDVVPDDNAQDLALDSTGRLGLWQQPSTHVAPLPGYPAKHTSTLEYGYDEQLVVMAFDSTLVVSGWNPATGAPDDVATTVHLDPPVARYWHTSYAKNVVWFKTTTGVVSFKLSNGPQSAVLSSTHATGRVRVVAGGLEILPTESGEIRILSADGRIESTLFGKAGVSARQQLSGRGLRFVQSGTFIERVLVP